jgi:hypothetical protein
MLTRVTRNDGLRFLLGIAGWEERPAAQQAGQQ